MTRPTKDMFHDDVFHDGMKRLAFLVGLAVTIVVMHRILYHLAF